MWWSADRNNKEISKSGAAFLAQWVRVGVRVWVKGWIGSTPVPQSHQKALPSSQTRITHRPKDLRDQIAR